MIDKDSRIFDLNIVIDEDDGTLIIPGMLVRVSEDRSRTDVTMYVSGNGESVMMYGGCERVDGYWHMGHRIYENDPDNEDKASGRRVIERKDLPDKLGVSLSVIEQAEEHMRMQVNQLAAALIKWELAGTFSWPVPPNGN